MPGTRLPPVFAALAFLCCCSAGAAYPERPIRYVLGSAPGGGPDIAARVIMAELGRRLGQQIIVENRPGASGTIGIDVIVRATPDGVPAFAELPTIAEAGVSGFDVSAWAGVIVPAGVPKAIVSRLNAEFNNVLAAPAVADKLPELGLIVAGGTPEQFAAHIKKETVRWADVVRRSGAKVD